MSTAEKVKDPKRISAGTKSWITRRKNRLKKNRDKEAVPTPATTKKVGLTMGREVYRSDVLHVVEFEPRIRMCKFHLHGQNSQRQLAMPFMQFTRYLGKQGMSLHVSFTNEPMKELDQDVYFPLLPNVWYPSLQCCLMHCDSTAFSDLVANFWNTRYLDCEDWYCFPVLDKETPMRSYKKWERMSLEDPKFILSVEWTHPCRLDLIPKFDQGGELIGNQSGKPEYGGSDTNRRDGPIRSFAVVSYDSNKRKKVLD